MVVSPAIRPAGLKTAVVQTQYTNKMCQKRTLPHDLKKIWQVYSSTKENLRGEGFGVGVGETA